jgi:hypothetical protein
MKKFSILIAAAAAACVAGNLWADSASPQLSSGGNQTQMRKAGGDPQSLDAVQSATGGAGAGKVKAATGKHFSKSDKSQVAGQLKGKGKNKHSTLLKTNSYMKYSKANGSPMKADAIDTFSKTGSKSQLNGNSAGDQNPANSSFRKEGSAAGGTSGSAFDKSSPGLMKAQ